MSLAIADLLTLVNEITGRAETDLTNYLRNVIHDLERDSVFLEGREEITLVTGTRSYAMSGLTNSYRLPIHLQPLDTDDLVYQELDEVSYEEYRDRLCANSGNGKPDVFAIFNNTIYLDPPPDADTYDVLECWGKINHGDTVSTILYDEKYRNLLVNGCAYFVFLRYGLQAGDKAQGCLAEYLKEKDGFIVRKANSKKHYIGYRDM